jgi:DNA invertase Pin-like site-specific DNA recombinase
MLVGYGRVSSDDQNLDLQNDALTGAGCDRIFADKISGAKDNRPGLDAALDHLRPGDTLVVWRLDRLGRSLKDLLIIIEDLNIRSIGFKSLTESIDTTTSGGKLIFSIFGAIAEFERQLIRERTLAGLAAARSRGRKSGRKIQHDDKKIAAVQHLAASSENSISQVCQTIGISRATYYRRSKLIDS